MEPVTRRHHGDLLKCLFRKQFIFGMPPGLNALVRTGQSELGAHIIPNQHMFLQHLIPSDSVNTRFLSPQIPSNFDAFGNAQAPANSGPTSSTTNAYFLQYLIPYDSAITRSSLHQIPSSLDAFRKRQAQVNAGSCRSAVHDVFAGF